MANENTAEWQIVNGRWEIVDSEYRTFEAGQESAYQANTKEEYPDGRLSSGRHGISEIRQATDDSR
jgi:hypothetical protein